MNDAHPSDSHESASMARPPSVASVDGWEAESSSAVQPTSEELADRLREDAPSRQPEVVAPEAVDEDHDDAPARRGVADVTDDDEPSAEKPTAGVEMERGEDGKFTKKRKLTASERKAVLQAEFNALTKQREDARRAFDAEEAERAAKRRQAPAASETPATPAAASKATPEDGEPDWDQYEEAGKPFSQYQKDHSAWLRKVLTAEADVRAERKAGEIVSAERERAMAVADVARQEARLDAIKAKKPDFEERVAANLADVPQTPVMAAVVRNHPAGYELLDHLADHPAEAQILATFQWTRPMMDALKASPDPTPLLSYWANHPEDQARVAHLDPVSALMALGRLAAELSGPGANNGSPRQTSLTTAKPPIRPLGATRSATTDREDDDIPFGPEYFKREIERQRQRASAR